MKNALHVTAGRLAVGSAMALALALAPVAHAAVPPSVGPHYHYVTDSMRFGTSVAESDGYAFDLDNDDRRDNTLGHVFAGLSNQLSVDANLAASIQSGDVVTLGSLRADSLNTDPSASWQIYPGKPTPDPVLTGGGTFAIDPAAPTSTLAGSVTHGRFTGGPGAVTVKLGLVAGQPPVEIHLAAARLRANCNATGCTKGKLGGGISPIEVDTVIIPAMASLFQAIVDAGCTTSSPDSCTGNAALIVALFDTNGDNQISADELRQNPLIQAILIPDVDLFNGHGRPGHDGANDSISLGLGFSAKNATFRVHESTGLTGGS